MTDTALTLTETEVNELTLHEEVIKRGLNTFVEVGTALLAIRDGRLYRAEFGTFEQYCLIKWNMSKPRAYQLIDAAEVAVNLSTIVDVLPATESQARPLSRLDPEQQREAWAIAVNTAPNGKITASHVERVVSDMFDSVDPEEDTEDVFELSDDQAIITPKVPHVSHNSGNNEWYTPAEFIEAAALVMGGIDLDPASSEIANQIVKANKFYTAKDDGLSKEWSGRVWMNPPYSSDLVWQFAAKIRKHYQDGDVTEAIVLVNNATETAWFYDMVQAASAIAFTHSRVKYLNEALEPRGAPLQGQAVIYFGKNVKKFRQAFDDLCWSAVL